jgi:hypothetical protein
VSVVVEYLDGPAKGTVQEFPRLDIALPSLLWSDGAAGRREATYHRVGDQPDPVSGHWIYRPAEPGCGAHRLSDRRRGLADARNAGHP